MPEAIHATIIALSLTFVAAGGHYRIQSQRSGERLDRTKGRLADFDWNSTVGLAHPWIHNGLVIEAGIVWMGFAPDAGGRALDWCGGSCLHCRLVDMDVPHSGAKPDRHSSDTPGCAFR